MDVNTLDLDTTLEDSCMEFSEFISRDPNRNILGKKPKNSILQNTNHSASNPTNADMSNLINSFMEINGKNPNEKNAGQRQGGLGFESGLLQEENFENLENIDNLLQEGINRGKVGGKMGNCD